MKLEVEGSETLPVGKVEVKLSETVVVLCSCCVAFRGTSAV